MLPRAAHYADDDCRDSAPTAVRVEPLRVVDASSAPKADDDDWGALLRRAKAAGGDEESEWEAQVARVKEELRRAEEREWAEQLARARGGDEDGEWSVVIQKARSAVVPAAPTASVPARRPAQPAHGRTQTVRGRPVPRASHPPRVTETPKLHFSLPGEQGDAEPIHDEVSRIVARASMPPPEAGPKPGMRTSAVALRPGQSEARSSVPTQRAVPAARVTKTPDVRPTSALPAPARTSLAPQRASVLNSLVDHVTRKPEPKPVAKKVTPEGESSAVAVSPAAAPSQARKSSPGMSALRVAAQKRGANESGVRPTLQASEAISSAERVAEPAQPSKVEPKVVTPASKLQTARVPRANADQPRVQAAQEKAPEATAKRASSPAVAPLTPAPNQVEQAVALVEAQALEAQEKKKKDSSLVGLSLSLEIMARSNAARPSRVAPPPPPRHSVVPPQPSAVRTGAPTSSATSPARPTPSGLPALRVPPPPPPRDKASAKARTKLVVPPPPPPSRTLKTVQARVVSRVRSAVATLTKRDKAR